MKKNFVHVVLALILFCGQFNISNAQCFSGAYTIGGSNPNFQTIRAAFDSIKQVGICGNVDLNIRPGFYADTLTLPYVNGSDQYKIRIKSENNDSSSVVFYAFPGGPFSNTYFFRLIHSQNIIFQKLTFDPGSYLTIFAAIFIQPDPLLNNEIEVLNNVFKSKTLHTGNAIVFANRPSCPVEVKIQNNYLYGPTIYFWGNSTDTASSLQISNNFFYGTSASMGIKGFSGKVIVNHNRIIDTLSVKSVAGIDIDAISSTFEGNYIHFKTGIGINSRFNSSSTSNTIRVINNFVQIDSSIYPAFRINSDQALIAFNTIRVNSVDNQEGTLFSGEKTISTIKNNIIINRGAKCNLIAVWRPSHCVIDYNRYETTAGLFGKANTTTYSTFLSWKSNTGFDAHSQFQKTSLSNYPGYKITGDLNLIRSGVSIAGITDDIEHIGRNVVTPTIGASEPVLILPDDAGIISMLIDETHFCEKTQPVKFLLRNCGSSPLMSAVIKWKINGIPQTDFQFSGNLQSGDSAAIDLGVFNFKGGKSYYFECHSTLPNGNPDLSPYNDATQLWLHIRLNGTYTVGGTNPDYTSLKEVESVLKINGMCGPVLFNLRNGTYTSGITINTIFGNSMTNGITFQSESLDSSKVVIADSARPIQIINSKNVCFRKLSFIEHSQTGYHSISASSPIRNLEITNCSFEKPKGVGYVLSIHTARASDEHFIIKNCVFKGSANFRIMSDAFPRINAKNCIIEGNYFYNNKENEISYMDSVAFVGNTISTIKIFESYKELFILNNKITDGDLFVLGFPDSLGPQKVIANNVINKGRMILNHLADAKIYHNTVVSTTNDLNEASFTLFGKISKQQIRNNIFVNKGKSFIYLIDDAEFNFLQNPSVFDYNTVYSSADTIQCTWHIHSWKSKFKTWVQWKSYARQDQHSLFFAPQFTSSTDLHPLNDKRINNSGQMNALVPFDLKGAARNKIHPDPGAYEFHVTTTSDDAGVISAEATNCDKLSTQFHVVLKNFGSNPLTSAAINWKLNGVAQPVYQWLGNLATDSSTSITLPNGTIKWEAINSLHSYTELPNGQPDSDVKNDTLDTKIALPSLNGTYTIGNSNADFNSFEEALYATLYRGVCGPVVFKINPGNYFPILHPELVFKDVNGNNTINTISFESSTGQDTSVIIHFDSFTFTSITSVSFKNLTFHGRFILGDKARSIVFEGNRIIPNVTGDAVVSHEYNENVQFINNYFSNARNFFYYTHPQGNKYPKGLIIKGNKFDDPDMHAIYLHNVDSLVVDSNSFHKKKINTGGKGLELHTDDYFKISRNTIAGPFNVGIHVSIPVEMVSSKKVSRLENNVVTAENGILIHIDSVAVLYNSVYANASNSSLGLFVPVDSVCNNIFVSEQGYASIIITNAPKMNYMNHNIYFTKGPQLIHVNMIEYSDLSSYTTATGLDTQSFMLDPEYISVTNDLHYQNKNLDGKALALKTVQTDLNGMKRHPFAPNPGAFEINKPISVPELGDEKQVLIYPNPFKDKTTISYQLTSKSEVEIEVENELGQLLKTIVSDTQSEGSYRYTLDLGTGKPSGVYFVKITIDGICSVKKLVGL